MCAQHKTRTVMIRFVNVPLLDIPTNAHTYYHKISILSMNYITANR